MIISLINHSESVADEQAQQVVRVNNRQLKDDFEPYWSFGATLRLEGPIGKQPSTTLSAMRGDAVLYLVEGNHPMDRRRRVFHLFEMCDAVQAESYSIEGVEVSNFVLPSYFSLGEQVGRRNDFLGREQAGKTLESFGMNPGGYLNIFDPRTGRWEQPAGPRDAVAALRKKLKNRLKAGRGYRRSHPGRC